MGYFVNFNTDSFRNYQILDKMGHDQFFDMFKYLKYFNIKNVGTTRVVEQYYDTPNNLLSKSGILLSRIQEGNRVFIRVENKAYDDAGVFDRQIFVHPVSLKSTIYDHAFYVKDGITSLFLTSFSIDLENVLKQVVPKIEIVAQADVYRIVNGAGLKIECAFEQRRYNKVTKKKNEKVFYDCENLIVKKISPEKVFQKDFDEFNDAVKRYCKAMVQTKESQSVIATRVLNKVVGAAQEKKYIKNEK